MPDEKPNDLLWWVIPGVLAGVPMPFIHIERRLNEGGAISSYDDELPVLYAQGTRAVVSLPNNPTEEAVYGSAGMSYLSLPVPDGRAPTLEQARRFVEFADAHRREQRPVAIHCEAGLGRTGTLLATYLIAQGESVQTAVERVRRVEKADIETGRQLQFLEQFAATAKT